MSYLEDITKKIAATAKTVQHGVETYNLVRDWLIWKGWLQEGSYSIPSTIALVEEFYGLQVTGEYSLNLLNLVTTPQCGCPDIINPSLEAHKTHQQIMPIVRQGQETTIYFHPSIGVLDRKRGDAGAVKECVLEACNWWSQYFDVKYVESDDPQADFYITPHARRRDGFGTSGNVLADMELYHRGQQRGRIDAAEDWYLEEGFSRGQISLMQTMGHEMGHGMGLGHIQKGLLAPMYSEKFWGIQPEDVEAMEKLGWKRKLQPSPTPDPPKPEETYQKVIRIRSNSPIEVDTLGS